MTDLPTRLSGQGQPVIYRARRGDAVAELREAIDRQYVHVLFTETHGQTELGFQLDESRSDLSLADWQNSTGSVHFEGELTLDGVRVRCVADINLVNASGEGCLEILSESA